tara:strand:+ start:941 stop:2161 length:1221 start_codon:yes stop_codon:yes gene_type:complete
VPITVIIDININFQGKHRMLHNTNTFIIKGGSVLLSDGTITKTDLRVSDGLIDAIGIGTVGKSNVLDASGFNVLPGAIDLHGDAFERQIMPRAGVSFPMDMALFETDRQLVSNGITTAFHGITYSWEPGLRSRDVGAKLIECLERLRNDFSCSTKFHLRFETYNLDAIKEVEKWLESERVDFLAFNDHMPSIIKKIETGQSLARFVERTGLIEREFITLVNKLRDRQGEVTNGIKLLAKKANENGIPTASHDDETAATRRFFNNIGCKIAEFPETKEAIKEAVKLDNNIVLGAPNVIRGGSHMGADGLSAADNIDQGWGNILCSDYYYPALINAPSELARKEIIDFSKAWNMVSKNAAYAANLADRGEIAVGKRADLVLLDPMAPAQASLMATLVGGRMVYQSRQL